MNFDGISTSLAFYETVERGQSYESGEEVFFFDASSSSSSRRKKKPPRRALWGASSSEAARIALPPPMEYPTTTGPISDFATRTQTFRTVGGESTLELL